MPRHENCINDKRFSECLCCINVLVGPSVLAVMDQFLVLLKSTNRETAKWMVLVSLHDIHCQFDFFSKLVSWVIRASLLKTGISKLIEICKVIKVCLSGTCHLSRPEFKQLPKNHLLTRVNFEFNYFFS